MDKAEKIKTVENLSEIFRSAKIVVVTRYSGLTVSDMTTLRHRMAESGANFRVIKNRLAKIAVEGTPCERLKNLLNGPTAIAFSEDPLAAPKVTAVFSKANENLVIVGGVIGDTVLDVQAVKALAELPSLDELRGRLVSLISAPATRIAGVLQAPASQLVRIMDAYAALSKAA